MEPLYNNIFYPPVFSLYNCLQCPYLKSGINSATLLRAAALDKTMIITKIPLIYDFGEELVFAYAYTDEQSHRKNLQKQIERVYKIRRESPETLENMGKTQKGTLHH